MPVDQFITIDRTIPFDPKSISFDFVVDHEDPQSLTLTSIDLSVVVIKYILDIEIGSTTNVNEVLTTNITRIKAEGGIFLDAKVLETLLKNPKSIPVGWISIADSDSMNTSDIQFLGTTLKASDSSKLYYLGISFDRGVWSISHTQTIYSDEDLTSFAEHPGLRIRVAAAVLIMKA